MRIHAGRAAVTTVALVEVGAVAGALACWLIYVGSAVATFGIDVLSRSSLLGMAVWSVLVGAPLGAIAVPLLGLSILRRAALWRVIVLPVGGALTGLALGARLNGSVARLPLPPLALVLAVGGMAVGILGARTRWALAPAMTRRRLPLWHRLAIAEADKAPSVLARCARTLRRALQLSSRR